MSSSSPLDPSDPTQEDQKVLALFDSLVEEDSEGENYFGHTLMRRRTMDIFDEGSTSDATPSDSELSLANTSSLELSCSEDSDDLRDMYGSEADDWWSDDEGDIDEDDWTWCRHRVREGTGSSDEGSGSSSGITDGLTGEGEAKKKVKKKVNVENGVSGGEGKKEEEGKSRVEDGGSGRVEDGRKRGRNGEAVGKEEKDTHSNNTDCIGQDHGSKQGSNLAKDGSSSETLTVAPNSGASCTGVGVGEKKVVPISEANSDGLRGSCSSNKTKSKRQRLMELRTNSNDFSQYNLQDFLKAKPAGNFYSRSSSADASTGSGGATNSSKKE